LKVAAAGGTLWWLNSGAVGMRFCAGPKSGARFSAARCPAEAFYAFANITGTGIGSKELADYLLYDAGVSCLNGGAFGSSVKATSA